MRRNDRSVTDPAEILDIIRRCDVCRLALFDEEYPYILPLNFGEEILDGRLTLYFHGAQAGKKYDLLARDSRASFEMDCSHRLVPMPEKQMCTMEYESVLGQGRLLIVPDEEKKRGIDAIMRHFHEDDFPYNPAVLTHTTVFKLTVEAMTAKRRMVR